MTYGNIRFNIKFIFKLLDKTRWEIIINYLDSKFNKFNEECYFIMHKTLVKSRLATSAGNEFKVIAKSRISAVIPSINRSSSAVDIKSSDSDAE